MNGWNLFPESRRISQPADETTIISTEGIANNENEVEDEAEAQRSITGLHWEIGTELHDTPPDKMEYTPSAIKEEYKHVFCTPIDSLFAIMPYVFWDLMTDEINRYAEQYLKVKATMYVCGYSWKPVTVNDVVTFFGLLIFQMLYPQTGCRTCTAWQNQQVNSWTSYMSKG